jgi:hypothetical protein
MKNKFYAIGLLALGVVSEGVAQVSVSYTNVISSQLTSWDKNLSLPKFNSSLGILSSIDISLSSQMSTAISVANQVGSSSTGIAKTDMQIWLGDNDFASLFNQGSGNPVLDYYTRGVSFSLAGYQTTNTSTIFASKSANTGLITDSTILQEFTGTGTVDLAASSHPLSTISISSGNATETQVTSAGLTTIITYDYTPLTPTPEPSSVAMMVGGLAGLGAVLRRRAAK